MTPSAPRSEQALARIKSGIELDFLRAISKFSLTPKEQLIILTQLLQSTVKYLPEQEQEPPQ